MSTADALTAHLGEYISSGSTTDLPPDAMQSAIELFADTIGVMFVGSNEPSTRIVATVASALGGNEQAVALPMAARTSAAHAALVNGTAAHALDLDDSHHPGLLHPSAVLVPAVLALGEQRGISGRHAIGSYLYGLDLVAGIGNAVNPGHYDQGWHSTCTIGSVAAAGACAKVLDLSAQQTVAALSIAMSESAGIRRNFGSMTKPVHAGMAASNGVTAALLAEQGLTVGDAVLEGPKGWLDLFAGAGGWSGERLTDVLDHRFGLAQEGLAIKRYAACGVTHPPIEAALELRRRGVLPEEIRELHLTVHPMVPGISSFMTPTTGLEAKFSLPYCIAIALRTGRAGLGEFTDEWVRQPEVDQLLRKVRISTDPTVGLEGHMSWGCILTASLHDGQEVTVDVTMAKGKWAGQRLTRDEIFEKFRECATAGGVADSDTNNCIELIERLDGLDSVGELADALLGAAQHATQNQT